MRRLKNKTAIITGGASGIGKAISEVFAEEGAAVFILDPDEQVGAELVAALRKREGDAPFIRADVSSEEDTGRAVRFTAERNQRIDILCNAASYVSHWHSVIEASP